MPNRKVGDRVLYKIHFNNLNNMMPGREVLGTIIHVCSDHPVYRIELDEVWGERLQPHAQDKNIVVGNIWGNHRITLVD